MSTESPATSMSPSTSAIDRPRSIRCVMPTSRGLTARAGRFRGGPATGRLALVGLVLVGADRDDHARRLAGHRARALIERRDRVVADADHPRDRAGLVAGAVDVLDER